MNPLLTELESAVASAWKRHDGNVNKVARDVNRPQSVVLEIIQKLALLGMIENKEGARP